MSTPTLRRLTAPKLLMYLSFAGLAIITLYCALFANYYQSGNSDNIIYPYFFQNFHLHDVILPGQHANILKFPLFILQSVLPYNFTSFSIFSIGLVLATTLGWAALTVRLFGKRYAPLVCLSLGSILLGSQLLNTDLLGTTIRNIELPIVFAFVLYTSTLLKKQTPTRLNLIAGSFIGLLFALTVAGDSFFLYTACLPLFGALGFYWLVGEQTNKLRRQYIFACTYLICFSILALAIRYAIGLLGIARYFTDNAFKPHVLPIDHLSASVSTALTQVLNMFGANIFGSTVSLSNSLVFLNFSLLLIGFIGLVAILCDGFLKPLRTKSVKRAGFSHIFSLSVMSLVFFLTYAAYVASDLVVSPDSHGQLVSASQERYLTILPFILIIGLAYVIWRNYDSRKSIFIGLPIIILLCMLLNMHSIGKSHVYDSSLRSGPIHVAKVAKENGVQVIIGSYWYGSSTRFWSNSELRFATKIGCNSAHPSLNNRISWYRPDSSVRNSALVVSRSGSDAQFWQCSDDQLVDIYGKPLKVIPVGGKDSIGLWIYDYDTRSKLIAPAQ